ncbi:MAG: hypothetical protein AUG44_19135 [Actinobacteria bacterium 13_1_20CM_3_71_11]|nr:MAG: hypothetical protein AUG44_19135 [Actinobacteria bacterium 13_1_20CM_3_71_11]
MVVVVLTLLFVGIAGALGSGLFTKLAGGGFDDPGAPSSVAQDDLKREFGIGQPNLVLLITSPQSVDDDAVAKAGTELTNRLAGEHGIRQVVSYWSTGRAPQLRGSDGKSAMVVAEIEGNVNDAGKRWDALKPSYTGQIDGLTVRAAGTIPILQETNKTVEEDLQAGEKIAFPVLFLALILVFGSLVAAFIPLIVTIPAAAGTIFTLWALGQVTDVSVFALNVTSIMGLGLSVDYSLFVLSRYREELRRSGADIRDRRARTEAIVKAVRTAGRTIVFSALTVAISLGALGLFPMYFLRSIAVAGAAVALLAALCALTLLPALLALFGSSVDRLDLRRGLRRLLGRKPRTYAEDLEGGFWNRLAQFVMRFPVPVALATIALLVVLGIPFMSVKFGLPDDRALPTTAQSHQVNDEIRAHFDGRAADPLSIVALHTGNPQDQVSAIADYALRISDLDGVANVSSLSGIYVHGAQVAPAGPATAQFATSDATWLRVVLIGEPDSDRSGRVVRDIRAMAAPWPVKVGGSAAVFVDTKATLGRKMPYALGLIAITMIIILFLFTGSILIPIKAVLLNLLSLTATFGSMVWIFQDGHLRHYLGDFTVTGSLVATAPILMFAAAFGLSMDYEVFLLSRVREEYLRTGNNTAAVARGLERTGRLVTAAAALMAIVAASVVISQITFLKMIGLGLFVAVLMDASIVRGLLVPAFMRMLGAVNWWAPGPLARWHKRFGLREAQDELDVPDVPFPGTLDPISQAVRAGGAR